MLKLKTLSPDAVPAALEKAERYRLLNEPLEAESICRDVLELDAGDQRALILLILSLTDRFAGESGGEAEAESKALLKRLGGEYERSYYAGIIAERRAKAHLGRGGLGAGAMAYHLLREAMDWYERAERVRPSGNDDPILRWNTCARLLMRSHVEPEPALEPMTELE